MNKRPFLGVAYYPEHWERSQIDEDLDKMVEHGITCVRIAEFAWKTMEPAEGKFDFSLFREVVDKCRERGIMVIMGTPGATPPLWLSNKYPDVYGERIDGVKRFHGARQDCCYSHEEYLHLALRITKKMAEEFGKDENVIGWQIDNEISASKDEMFCVCPRCVENFKKWVSRLYDGDVQKFNREVGAYVFSSSIDSFEELHRPYKQWTHPGYQALWRRFQFHLAEEYTQSQYDAIKLYTDKPVGTDIMPFYHTFSFEHAANHTDIVQFNQYFRDNQYYQMEFWANYLYNMKGKPYWLTETSCCWNGSVTSNYMRHKGFVGMNGWMNLAAGAESVNYWLWRTHYAGHELMHGSVIESSGRPRHIKDEVIALSADMEKCADLINGTRPEGSGLSLIASENSARTFEFQKMYSGFDYYDTVTKEFNALAAARLRPSALIESASFDKTKVLYTPYLLSLENRGLAEKILKFVENGGTWLATPLTDVRTASEAKYRTAPTGVLEKAANVEISFTIPAYSDASEDGHGYSAFDECGREYTARDFVYDALTPGDGVRMIARYTDEEYLRDYAAITESTYGKGKIVMLGFVPTEETIVKIISRYCAEAGIAPFVEADKNVCVIKRCGDFEAIVAIEHEFKDATLTAPFDCIDMVSDEKHSKGDVINVGKYGVKVLKKA